MLKTGRKLLWVLFGYLVIWDPHTQGLVVFKIDDTTWVLDLKEGGKGEVYEGPVKGNESADLTLTISDTDFVRLVMGKISAQQVGKRTRHDCSMLVED